MKIAQQGFTLLELIIVVAIIGVLASIVIPSYCDYLGRTKVIEALTVVTVIKTYIGEQEVVSQPLPELVDDSLIESVTWHPQYASLLVALSSKVTSYTINDGKYVVFTLTKESETIRWQCHNQHPLIREKAINNRDLPISCRS